MADELRPGEWTAVTLAPEQQLVVSALAESQTAELIAHSAADLRDRLSTLLTALAENVHEPRIGTRFWTQDYHPLFRIVDQSHGQHDMMLEACNPGLVRALFGSDTPTCSENFGTALAEHGLEEKWVPYPLGIFRRCGEADGRFQLLTAASSPGDYITLEADTRLLVVVSACPIGAPKQASQPTLRVEVT
jgi:uncharacterized protein YcgI (DUF1989 family)